MKKNNTKGFLNERRSPWRDLDTVESQRNDLTAEEFPEGAYGSSLPTESLGKSSPWRIDQRPPNAFAFENKALHDELPREEPASHAVRHEGDEEEADKF